MLAFILPSPGAGISIAQADQTCVHSLTCRHRKLKCDEQRPRCGQCQKAQRECVPSDGIVFRHQQNASMNDPDDHDGDSLQGFYAYKNTFTKDSIWVKIPKRSMFLFSYPLAIHELTSFCLQ